MRLRIFPEIFVSFPDLHLGVTVARGIDNRGECAEIAELIRKKQAEISNKYAREGLEELARIQSWRRAYASFGAKPKKHRSSVENLLRMALEGKDLRSINKVVDIYNYISLLHQVPVGGDDLAGVEGDIFLKFARGDEPFKPLGSGDVQTARKGEVIYVDEREVLCRRWNWRESEKTKMTERTRDVLLVSEGLPPVTAEDMRKIVAGLAQMIRKYCGGKTKRGVLNAEISEWEL